MKYLSKNKSDFVLIGALVCVGGVLAILLIRHIQPDVRIYVLGSWNRAESKVVEDIYTSVSLALWECKRFRKTFPNLHKNFTEQIKRGVYFYRLGEILENKEDATALGRAVVGGDLVELDLEGILRSPYDTVYGVVGHELLHIAGLTHSSEFTFLERDCL